MESPYDKEPTTVTSCKGFVTKYSWDRDTTQTVHEECTFNFPQEYKGKTLILSLKIFREKYEIVTFDVEGFTKEEQAEDDFDDRIWDYIESEITPALCWDLIEDLYETYN